MNHAPDLAEALFVLPPDAKLLPVGELSDRLRARIGPVEDGQAVITRAGFRVSARLVPGPLAALVSEFRTPSRLTDGVLRFARAHDQDPQELLDLTFDALATLVEARILVPEDSPEAKVPQPSLGAGQAFAGFEIEALVRGLEDSEVYRARSSAGEAVALKIARDGRAGMRDVLANEARMLDHLAGVDSPSLLASGSEQERPYVAMEWCDGVSIVVAAQQARAARDRRRLQRLVSALVAVYGRLHARGVLHGDVHPGNCLVGDDGRLVLVDFGSARRLADQALTIDLGRAGIPQFHDPLMAEALLARRAPPAATPASEQYAIAVLAYLLLTGLHPIEAPAEQDELLRRIVARPPLPFTARGVAAWPAVEAVLARALARRPEERFPDVAAFAAALAAAPRPAVASRRRATAATRAFDQAVAAVRRLEPDRREPRDQEPRGQEPRDQEPRDQEPRRPEPGRLQAGEAPGAQAWFALRAALALEDGELLAATELLAGRLGGGWAERAVVAHVARARSDGRMDRAALAGMLAAVEALPEGPEVAAALRAVAGVLAGAPFRHAEAAALAGWAGQRLEALDAAAEEAPPASAAQLAAPGAAQVAAASAARIAAALALVKAGAIALPADLPARLEALDSQGGGGVWLWALAHDVLADERFEARALAAPRPRAPLARGLALLRLHQLTGDRRWVTAARRLAAPAARGRSPWWHVPLLVAELEAPEQAVLPPFPLADG